MSKPKPPMPAFFDTKVEYELTKEQLIEAVRQYTGLPDGFVTFDVAGKGTVRGATVRAQRLEIKG